MSEPVRPAIAHRDPKLPPLPDVPEGPDWAGGLKVFDAPMATALLAVTRTLYPHQGLREQIYRRVIARFDAAAAASPVVAQGFAAFVDGVNGAMPLPFAELSEGFREQVLKRLEGTAAFTLVQRLTVRFLYDDVEVWEAFGYEGAAVHLGGYVTRGFDDLDWLPTPQPGDY
ncbi:hypothetical protein MWN34_10350 [Ancylobacter sp. 6x-1]|uniref:Gluconate 2-dehydrogenase subunit 3 family protein n=1 Tax=Ancylobacter crimeensis TaxID=2579147 RepID=A0ABT0DC33_9HYPH|nr:hypothetical protein [Ancylobacter crimeensis]MCK0197312.1 hypothetical protein [Ancylobacter crimeensis]